MDKYWIKCGLGYTLDSHWIKLGQTLDKIWTLDEHWINLGLDIQGLSNQQSYRSTKNGVGFVLTIYQFIRQKFLCFALSISDSDSDNLNGTSKKVPTPFQLSGVELEWNW